MHYSAAAAPVFSDSMLEHYARPEGTLDSCENGAKKQKQFFLLPRSGLGNGSDVVLWNYEAVPGPKRR
jgi:hypothetical protein